MTHGETPAPVAQRLRVDKYVVAASGWGLG